MLFQKDERKNVIVFKISDYQAKEFMNLIAGEYSAHNYINTFVVTFPYISVRSFWCMVCTSTIFNIYLQSEILGILKADC